MGKKGDKIIGITKNIDNLTNDVNKKAADTAEKARRAKKEVEMIERLDIDDELLDSVKEVRKGVKTDAHARRKAIEENELRKAKDEEKKGISIAEQLIKSNDEAKRLFSQIESISDFGKSQVREGRRVADRSSKDAKVEQEKMEKAVEKAQAELDRAKEIIDS